MQNNQVLKVQVVLSFPTFFPFFVFFFYLLRAGGQKSLHTSVLLNSLASHAVCAVCSSGRQQGATLTCRLPCAVGSGPRGRCGRNRDASGSHFSSHWYDHDSPNDDDDSYVIDVATLASQLCCCCFFSLLTLCLS